MKRHLSLLTIAALLFSTAPAVPAVAAETGSLTIVQENESRDTLGDWTLIRPDNSRVELDKREEYSKPDAVAGRYSLLIEKPEGSTAKVVVYKEGEIIDESNQPQAIFEILPGDNITIQILYKFTQVGTISVGSTPVGVDFRIEGPNDWNERATTPAAYPDSPIGLYSVTYFTPKGCPKPRTLSKRLENGGRADFGVRIECDKMQDAQSAERAAQFEFVTMMDGNTMVTFEDVRLGEWFSQYVHNVARIGIVTGYKDGNGKPSGRYGPGDNVTVAQLAKIAVQIAGINENEYRGRSVNERARGQWFEKFFIVAEQNDWQVYRDDRQDPGRLATRAEVIATVLQALDILRVWPKGEMFTDVSARTKYAASIETAVTDGVLGGYEDGTFRPDAPINRAEIAKLISLVIQAYIEDSPEFLPDS